MTSFSRISAYDRCAHNYELQKSYPNEATFPMKSGITAHKLLQDYGNHCVGNKRESDFEFFDKLVSGVGDMDSELAFDVEMAVKKAKTNLSIPRSSKFELEFAINDKFELVPFNSKGYFFRGVIDWVDFISKREVVLTDFKTGWKMASPALQLKLYAAVLMMLMPEIELVRTRWYYTRKNKYIDGPEVERNDIPGAQKLLFTRLTEMSTAKAYPPTISIDSCPSCGVRAYCKFYKQYVTEFKNEDFAKDPEKLYNQWKLFEALSKDLQKRVKGLADTVGFIKVGTQKFTKTTKPAGMKLKNGLNSSHLLIPFTTSSLTLTAAINEIDLSGTQIRDVVRFAHKDPKLASTIMALVDEKTKNEYRLVSSSKEEEAAEDDE